MAQKDELGPVKGALWRAIKERAWGPSAILRFFGIERPPIDVVGLVTHMGVTLVPSRSKGLSGALLVDGARAEIHFHQSDSALRQRFTIAHELAHLLLHDSTEGRPLHRLAPSDGSLPFDFVDKTFSGTQKEIEANRFAADLLMPLPLLDALASGQSNDVNRLAKLFEVSQEAMTFRMMKLAGHR